jgi:phage gpG-like protein
MQIEIQDAELTKYLSRLASRMNDATPMFREVGEVVKASVERNFAVGGRYSGNTFNVGPIDTIQGGSSKWRELSPEYKKYKRRKYGNQPILTATGALRGSITIIPSSNSVEIGPTEKYGVYHQLGTKNMAMRPFLVLQYADVSKIIKLIKEYFKPI